MPANGFSLGRDKTLVVVTKSGPIRFEGLTGFTSKKTPKTKLVHLMNGVNTPVSNRSGEWTGSFEIERRDSTVDQLFAQLEANYFAGLNEDAASITETIAEPNGTISQFRFTGVILDLDDAGNWKGDATVPIKVSFMAARRIQL